MKTLKNKKLEKFVNTHPDWFEFEEEIAIVSLLRNRTNIIS